MTALAKYDAMCRAIDAAHKVDEVKEIRDKAIALQHYARQAQNTDAERRAAQIRLRAERKAGQLLAQTQKSKGTRGQLKGRRSSGGRNIRPPEKTPTLRELGITKDQSSQWQQLGKMRQDEFDVAIGTADVPTTERVLADAKPPRPGPKVGKDSLWLWGRLLDFERDALLVKRPADLIATMRDPMKDDVHRLAPKVATWLKQIGATNK